MPYKFTLNLLPLIITVIISGTLALYIWRHRKTAGATPLAVMMFILFEWGLTYVIELAATDMQTKVFWEAIKFIGVVFSAVAWVVFALEFTGRKVWVNRQRLIVLSVVPLLTTIIIFTNNLHGLFRTSRGMEVEGGYLLLTSVNGTWYWVHALYTYTLIMVGLVLIVRALLRWPAQYRGQMILLLLSTLTPLIANVITVFQIIPILIDLTPFAFTITGIGMAYALFRHRFLDIAPIARDVIIEEMKDGIIVADESNTIVDINKTALEIIGMTGEVQPIGKQLADVLSRWPDLAEKYRSSADTEDEISLKQGDKTFWYTLNLSTLYDKGKQSIGRILTVRNITEQKLAQSQLEESEARFRQIVEHASDVIYRIDKNGYLTYANPAALRAMGYEEEDAIGKYYLDLTTPEMRHKLKRTYQHQFVSNTKISYHEFPAIASDGSEVWFGQNVQLIYEGDEIIGFQALARDITTIRQAQDALRIARDQALEANRAKSQLLSKVSHELRTPLGGVLGYAELLQNNTFGELNPRQQKAVSEIVDSADYLTNMVNELLDEAQLRSSTASLLESNFSSFKLIQGAVSGLDILAQKKGLKFSMQIDPNLPQEIYGDDRRIRQIIINLIGNAIKFTKEGSVHLNVSKADDNHWEIQVKDTGIGIPKEAQYSIFEPFRQVNKSVTPDNRGVGLGLSITKQLVELMHGRIIIESIEGKGTTFHVLLPLTKAG